MFSDDLNKILHVWQVVEFITHLFKLYPVKQPLVNSFPVV